jgi:hypothetical protein
MGARRKQQCKAYNYTSPAAQSWLGKLGKETIGSMDELAKQFISNFKSTYEMPASTEEVKACTQKSNESLRLYIQRWSIIKNSAEDVSHKRAIGAFTIELHRADFVKEMGRIKPETVA